MKNSKLKAYYFSYKYRRDNVKDRGVISTSKKDAIDYMGSSIEDFFKSKIRVVDFEIVSIEKRVFKRLRYENGRTIPFFDEDISADAEWKEFYGQGSSTLNLVFSDDEKTSEALEKYFLLLQKEIEK